MQMLTVMTNIWCFIYLLFCILFSGISAWLGISSLYIWILIFFTRPHKVISSKSNYANAGVLVHWECSKNSYFDICSYLFLDLRCFKVLQFSNFFHCRKNDSSFQFIPCFAWEQHLHWIVFR